MRNLLLLILLLAIAAACMPLAASSTETQTSSTSEQEKPDKKKAEDKKKDKGPRLVLTVFPRQGFMPLRVSLNAVLEGVDENDEKYHCLQEEWDFGDGAVSSEKLNCEPFTKDTKINLHFFADHLYDNEGTYTIKLSLGDPVKIRSNPISINVLEREMGR